MIALLQRVKTASVSVADVEIAHIGQGLLVLLGVEKNDDDVVAAKLAEKILKYRMFSDNEDKMNLSVIDIQGDVLMVPQFTLAADTQKGLRPSFSSAASPEKGFALFTQLIDIMHDIGHDLVQEKGGELKQNWLQTGEFGADMAVALVNDGPVTFSLKA